MSPDTKKLTPLLVTSEKKTIGERITYPLATLVGILIAWILYSVFVNQGNFDLTIAWIVVIILIPLLYFVFSGGNKISLYEEGVYVKSGLRSWLYGWDSIKSFTVDKNKKSFLLKRKSFPSVLLISREHFDEVEKILSEHITPK